MNLYDLPADMREMALELAREERVLDYRYYDSYGNERDNCQPRWTHKSLRLRAELWEKFAPMEWVEGSCPHRYLTYRGIGAPKDANLPFMLWTLGNVPLLRTIEEIVLEAETRYRAWLYTHLKWREPDPRSFTPRVIWQNGFQRFKGEMQVTWTHKAGTTEDHRVEYDRALRYGRQMVEKYPGLRNPYEPLVTLEKELKVPIHSIVAYEHKATHRQDSLLRLVSLVGDIDRINSLPDFVYW